MLVKAVVAFPPVAEGLMNFELKSLGLSGAAFFEHMEEFSRAPLESNNALSVIERGDDGRPIRDPRSYRACLGGALHPQRCERPGS